VVAVVLFCAAGVLFVILSLYDGFSALASHGVDVRLTDNASSQILIAAGITWLIGLACAVLGVLIWVTNRLPRPLLMFLAASEVAAMVVLIGAASAIIGAASGMRA
jgi:hypothetical protein